MTEYLKTIANRIGETNEVLEVVANRIGETNELLKNTTMSGETKELLQVVANRIGETNELLTATLRAPRGSGVQAAQALRSQQAEQQADASDQSAPV